MKRRFRLTRSTDFQRVRRFGKSYAHPLIVLVASPSDQEKVRIGVVAGRPVGKAVQRNRAKRLLRAAAQPFLQLMKPGFDLVLIARKPLVEARYTAVHTAVASLLKRAGLLREVDDV